MQSFPIVLDTPLLVGNAGKHCASAIGRKRNGNHADSSLVKVIVDVKRENRCLALIQTLSLACLEPQWKSPFRFYRLRRTRISTFSQRVQRIACLWIQQRPCGLTSSSCKLKRDYAWGRKWRIGKYLWCMFVRNNNGNDKTLTVFLFKISHRPVPIRSGTHQNISEKGATVWTRRD